MQDQTSSPAPVVVEAPSSLNSNDDIDEVLTDRKIGKGHILSRIAFCESTKQQYGKNGSVLQGKVDSRDTGLFQINTKYHLKTAKSKGIDIYTIEGNVDYALYLYKTQGTRPWNSSKPCWGKYLAKN